MGDFFSDETRTLHDLRTDRGWGHDDVVRGVASILREAKVRHWSASAQWEGRGVKSAKIRAALAALYDVQPSRMCHILDNTRAHGRPEGVKRGRRKNIPKSHFTPCAAEYKMS